MAGKIRCIDKQDVEISVVVVVNECAAGAHGLGQISLAKAARVMHKLKSCLLGNVNVVDARIGDRSRRRQRPPEPEYRGHEARKNDQPENKFAVP